MSRELASKEVKTISLDRYIDESVRVHSLKAIEADVEDFDFSDSTAVDTVLLLDVIEHLKSPEDFMSRLRDRYAPDAPEVVITTGNVAFLPIRLALFFGQFNYGKRGILDLTHTRLFTFRSLRRLLTQGGYDVLEEVGLPAPFPMALGDNAVSRLLLNINRVLIKVAKGLFSYQIATVVAVRPTLNLLLRRAETAAVEKLRP